jgi:hypothetical protein
METINITIKIEPEQVTNFENWLRQHLEVIDFKILPNTDKLYETDKTFQRMVKAVKKAQKERDLYINNNSAKLNG